MSTIAVIPARGGSKGLPKKNIIDLAGQPLISYTIEAAKNANLVEQVVVSTDSDEIAKVALEYGAKVVKRPPNISKDDSPIEDAVRHVVRTLGRNSIDAVVLLQANVPIRKLGQIDHCLNRLVETGSNSVGTVYEVDQRPELMKMLQGDHLIPCSTPNEYRRQDFPPYYLLDGAVLAIRSDTLFDTEGILGAHRFLGDKVSAVVEEPIFSIELDDYFDFLVANAVIAYIRSGKIRFDKLGVSRHEILV